MIERVFQLWADLCHKGLPEVVAEWHCFWIGYFEGLCLFIPARFPRTANAKKEMAQEEHYYQWGRGFGFPTALVISAALIRWVF